MSVGDSSIPQRRGSQRVTMPPGSVAILWQEGKLHNALYVRDLSPAGMLVCTGSPTAGITVDSVLNDIVISIPATKGRRGRTLPPIDQGLVVRSFYEAEHLIYCHAVAFRYESEYVRETLHRLPETAL